MQHQLQYGARVKGQWHDAPWNGDVEGEVIRYPEDPKKKGPPPRPGRRWHCRIENLSPGPSLSLPLSPNGCLLTPRFSDSPCLSAAEKYVVRVRSKNALGWSKWSWNSKPIMTPID